MIRWISQRDVAAMLDRPIWTALTTAHRGIAEGNGFARRLPAGISPFTATFDDGQQSMDDLGRLLLTSPATAAMLQASEIVVPDWVSLASRSLGVQMLAERVFTQSGIAAIGRLGADDAADMLALAERTQPGPFFLHTHRLGRFWGVRRNGQLVAMAGERLRQPGFTEISAVCVDRDHRGHGLATELVITVAAAIQARGETPYLHAYADNAAAISIYERLGFRIRCTVNIGLIEAASAHLMEDAPEPPSRWTPNASQPEGRSV